MRADSRSTSMYCTFFRGEVVMKIFSLTKLPLPLTQEEKLSVNCERMYT